MQKIKLLSFFIFLIHPFVFSQNPCGLDLLTVNDTSFCTGESVLISALPEYDNYLWDTGSEDQAISISTPGTYTVSTSFTTNNLVTNGNFSSGNQGFSSSYSPPISGTQSLAEGKYTITTNANNAHSNFFGIGDGNFMVVNGSTTPGTKVWCQDVIVEPQTMYNFASMVINVAVGDLAILQFSINGEEIGSSFTAPNIVGTWNEFNATWFSGTETVAEICVINQNVIALGNDFGLDDITFTTLCSFSESITVTDIEVITPETDLFHQICVGEVINLNTNGMGFSEYSWSNGHTNSNINVRTSDTYTVTLVDYNECVQELEFIVTDKEDCEKIVMPNVFTPNGDSKNNLFVPVTYEYVPSSTLKIYNRWGDEVYYSQSVLEGWNGKHFSEDCPEGVYYWVLEYQTSKGYHHTLNGYVNLLR